MARRCRRPQRLDALCERGQRAAGALAYNEPVQSRTEIEHRRGADERPDGFPPAGIMNAASAGARRWFGSGTCR